MAEIDRMSREMIGNISDEKKASGRKSHKCEETFATYSLNYCDFLNRATVSALQKAKEVYRTFHLYRANAMKILSFHRIFRKKM